jgi:outer membrane protein OmpA-like peptidoglycan-associated protein
MAIPLFTLPNHYLEKWFPDRIWAMLNTPPVAKADVEPQSSNPADKPELRVRQPGAVTDPGTSARREFRSNPGPANATVQKPAPGPVLTAIADDLPLPPTYKPSQQQPAGPKTTRSASDPAPALAPEKPPSTDKEIETISQPQDTMTPKSQPAQLAAVAKPKEPEVQGKPPGDDASRTAKRSGAPYPRPLMVREVSFGFDSTEIRPQDRSLLDEVATSMKASNQWMAHIVGYTDSVGSKKYNQHLSQLRANVVAAYLSRQGISHNRLIIEGRGSFERLPYKDDQTPAQLSARLVRIVLEPSN